MEYLMFFFEKQFKLLSSMFSNYKCKINRYPSLPITPKGVMK